MSQGVDVPLLGEEEPPSPSSKSSNSSSSVSRTALGERKWPTPRMYLLWSALLIVLALAVLSFRMFSRDEQLPIYACPRLHDESGDAPWLHIVGGTTYHPGAFDWDGSTCMEDMPGSPRCNPANHWVATVTVCLDGDAHHNVKIRTRGHVSVVFPKNQFSLKFEKPVSLMGFAPARTWVLAMSFVDATFQRNPLAFDMYRRLGGWAPQTRYVNVRLQGMDMGLYYVGEKIDAGPGRLDFVGPSQNDVLISSDWPDPKLTHVTTPVTSSTFNFISPEHPSQNARDTTHWLLGRLDNMEKDVADLVNWNSVARFYVLEELARDIDGYVFSSYWRVHDGQLFHAAPWDFDLAFGFICEPYYYRLPGTPPRPGVNVTIAPSVSGWNVEFVRDGAAWSGKTGVPGTGYIDFHMNRRLFFTNLWRRPQLREAFQLLWLAQRAPGGSLSDSSLVMLVDSHSDMIRRDAERDLGIWKDAERCGMFTTCCHKRDSNNFGRATSHLKAYLLARARWIDENVHSL